MSELQKMENRFRKIVDEVTEIVNEMARVVAIDDPSFLDDFLNKNGKVLGYLQRHTRSFIDHFFDEMDEHAFNHENECTRSCVSWAEAQVLPLYAEYQELGEKYRVLRNEESAARRMAEEIANREFAASLIEESSRVGRQIILEDTGDNYHQSWKMVRVEAAPSPGRVDDQGDAVVEMMSEDIGIVSDGSESVLVLHDLEGRLSHIMNMRSFMDRRDIAGGILKAKYLFGRSETRVRLHEAVLSKLAESEDGMRNEEVASALPLFNENFVRTAIWDLEKTGKIEFVYRSCNFRVVKCAE